MNPSRSLLTLAMATLARHPALAIEPYSAGTVATLYSAENGQLIHRSDITNPSQVLLDEPSVISYGTMARNGSATATARLIWQVAAFRVPDLLASIGSSDPTELANFTFTYRGVTEDSATLLPGASEYRAADLAGDAGALVTTTSGTPVLAVNLGATTALTLNGLILTAASAVQAVTITQQIATGGGLQIAAFALHDVSIPAAGSLSFSAAGIPTITWTVVPGFTYTIWRSPDLDAWEEMGTASPAGNSLAPVIFTDSSPFPSRGFYRLSRPS